MGKYSIASAAALLGTALVFCGCPATEGPTVPRSVKSVNNTTTDSPQVSPQQQAEKPADA